MDERLHVLVRADEVRHDAPCRQLAAQMNEERHRASVDGLDGGHVEVEVLASLHGRDALSNLVPDVARFQERQLTAKSECGVFASVEAIDGRTPHVVSAFCLTGRVKPGKAMARAKQEQQSCPPAPEPFYCS
jgi:hypothetical protein